MTVKIPVGSINDSLNELHARAEEIARGSAFNPDENKKEIVYTLSLNEQFILLDAIEAYLEKNRRTENKEMAKNLQNLINNGKSITIIPSKS